MNQLLATGTQQLKKKLAKESEMPVFLWAAYSFVTAVLLLAVLPLLLLLQGAAGMAAALSVTSSLRPHTLVA